MAEKRQINFEVAVLEQLGFINVRLGRIEERMDRAETDIRQLGVRFEATEDKMASLFEGYEVLDRKLNNFYREFDEFRGEVYERFGTINERFNTIDQRLDGIDRRLDAMDGKFASLMPVLK